MRLCFSLENLDAPARLLMSELALNVEKPMSVSKKPYEVSRLYVSPGLKFFVLHVEPIFPDFAPYGLVVAATGFILGWGWMYIPAGIMLGSHFFHSRWAYCFGLWLGLKKKKSKAKVRVLRMREVLDILLWGEKKVGSG